MRCSFRNSSLIEEIETRASSTPLGLGLKATIRHAETPQPLPEVTAALGVGKSKQKGCMRRIVEGKLAFFSEKPHLGLSLLLRREFTEAVVALIKGDNDTQAWTLELVAYAPQSNMSSALRLVFLSG